MRPIRRLGVKILKVKIISSLSETGASLRAYYGTWGNSTIKYDFSKTEEENRAMAVFRLLKKIGFVGTWYGCPEDDAWCYRCIENTEDIVVKDDYMPNKVPESWLKLERLKKDWEEMELQRKERIRKYTEERERNGSN